MLESEEIFEAASHLTQVVDVLLIKRRYNKIEVHLL